MRLRKLRLVAPLVLALVLVLVVSLGAAAAEREEDRYRPKDPSFYREFGVFYDQANGDIYVSDSLAHRIIKTRMDGTGWVTLGTLGDGVGQFNNPRGICFDAATGYVYVTDTCNHRIVKTKMDGSGWTTLGTKGQGEGQFYYPRGMWYDPGSDFVFVPDTSNHRIVKTHIDGSGWSTLGTIGKGEGQFITPRGVQYDPASSQLYVADTGNSRVVRCAWDGSGWTTLGSYGKGEGRFRVPRGLNFDSGSGLLYVADQSNNRIVATRMDGSDWTEFGEFGNSEGQFYYPRGISVDPDSGQVYVADTFNDRIVSTKMDGSDWTTLGVKWRPYAWYFAEGNTRTDFQMYLTILNPGEKDATVFVRYILGDGTQLPDQKVQILAHSRYTINVNEQVGNGKDVSVKVWSTEPVIVERPMYFKYKGWPGGNVVMGRPELGLDFYFAEGTTREGFETYLCMQNPDPEQAANVDIQYLFSGEQPMEQHVTLEPHSRKTINVNSVVGPGRDVSIVVHSDSPILAERPMYFKYNGKITGGHVVIGASQPDFHFFLAEGTTNHGFQEYICILNPGDAPANVELTYLFGDGTNQVQNVTVPARERYTIHVNDVVGDNKDVSVDINSDQPVVVERPMYFVYTLRNGQTVIVGGHNVMAVTEPGTDFLFAEGTTRPGFDEWICMMNPGEDACEVTITYMFASGIPARTQTLNLMAKSRSTISVNDTLRGWGLEGEDVSLSIHSTQPIVVERPMYFNFNNGVTGGSDTVGFSQ